MGGGYNGAQCNCFPPHSRMFENVHNIKGRTYKGGGRDGYQDLGVRIQWPLLKSSSPLASCVALGKDLNLSVPWFPHP